MHWGSIEIDIDIAKCFEELLKLLLILQNPLPNIDVFSISKKSVSHIPAISKGVSLGNEILMFSNIYEVTEDTSDEGFHG